MRAYLAGPMRGYPRRNFELFTSAKADLVKQGIEVVSPVDIGIEFGETFDKDEHKENPELASNDRDWETLS